MKKEEAFYIGYITKTKGLKGEVQLYFEFDAYEDLDLDVVFADMNGKMVPFFVDSHKLYPNSTGLFYCSSFIIIIISINTLFIQADELVMFATHY